MKVSVVGGGNAGVFSALYFGWYAEDAEVELIYDPEILPERVGQATLLQPPALLWSTTGFNWYDNQIHATMKSGILYEGWGQVNDKVYHSFTSHSMAMHYCPWEMQKHVLNSGHFKVVEGRVDDINNIDSDLIFDCRGKPDDYSNYDELVNPINACILAKPNWDTTKALWSRHVATPDGWTFVIPTHEESPSHDYCVGYCYNSCITSKEDAEKNMLDMFDVKITKNVDLKNYVAKNAVIDNRIVLNGNRLFFLEPMESSSTETYIEVINYVGSYGVDEHLNSHIRKYIKQVQNFVLWHYNCGSKYNTPFWDYAKSLIFNDPEFKDVLSESLNGDVCDLTRKVQTFDKPLLKYGQWNSYAFRVWYDGMFKKQK